VNPALRTRTLPGPAVLFSRPISSSTVGAGLVDYRHQGRCCLWRSDRMRDSANRVFFTAGIPVWILVSRSLNVSWHAVAATKVAPSAGVARWQSCRMGVAGNGPSDRHLARRVPTPRCDVVAEHAVCQTSSGRLVHGEVAAVRFSKLMEYTNRPRCHDTYNKRKFRVRLPVWDPLRPTPHTHLLSGDVVSAWVPPERFGVTYWSSRF
jgi:hypothetical protein